MLSFHRQQIPMLRQPGQQAARDVYQEHAQAKRQIDGRKWTNHPGQFLDHFRERDLAHTQSTRSDGYCGKQITKHASHCRDQRVRAKGKNLCDEDDTKRNQRASGNRYHRTE